MGLGISMALASSYRNRPLDPEAVVFGEVGLTGEVRATSQAERRINEAVKMGFRRCIMPQNNVKRLQRDCGISAIGVDSVLQALELL